MGNTLKYIIGIILAALSTYLGKRKSNEIKNKYEIWDKFNEINELMISNQTIQKNSVIEVLNIENNSLSKAFIEYITKNKPIDYPDIITEQDRELINRYLDKLGKGSSKEQSELYFGYKQIIKDKIFSYKSIKEKYSSMYVKLGFLFGVVIVIIIL